MAHNGAKRIWVDGRRNAEGWQVDLKTGDTIKRLKASVNAILNLAGNCSLRDSINIKGKREWRTSVD